MIDYNELELVYNESIVDIINSCDNEISKYKTGSIDSGKSIRSKLSYLECYVLALNGIISANNDGFNYEDIDISESDIKLLLGMINELKFELQ